MSTKVQNSSDVVSLVQLESRDARTARRSAAILMIVCGALLALASFTAKGDATFALSDPFAATQIPPLVLPGMPTALIGALLGLAGGVTTLLRRLPRWSGVAVTVVAAVGLVLGFMAWAAAGRQLPFQLAELLMGTIVFATPLVYGTLCGVMCERAGVVNVAIEGQMLTAALAGSLVGSMTKSLLWGTVAGMLAGVVMAALLAVFSIKYLVDQVVLGVVINLFAAGLTGFLLDAMVNKDPSALNNAPTFVKLPIPGLNQIPFFGPTLFEQKLLVYLAVVAVAVVWFVLYRTKWGLRIRAVGEHPKAADTVGIDVLATRWSAVLFGGLFAGLGGVVFTLQLTGAFNKNITVGNGFIALAALIMGRWHPVRASLMAVLFGFVTQLGAVMQQLNTPVPTEALKLLPYLATIIAVAGLVGRVQAPAADGTPYVK